MTDSQIFGTYEASVNLVQGFASYHLCIIFGVFTQEIMGVLTHGQAKELVFDSMGPVLFIFGQKCTIVPPKNKSHYAKDPDQITLGPSKIDLAASDLHQLFPSSPGNENASILSGFISTLYPGSNGVT